MFHAYFCPKHTLIQDFLYHCQNELQSDIFAGEAGNKNIQDVFATSLFHSKSIGDAFHKDNNLKYVYLGEVDKVIEKFYKDASIILDSGFVLYKPENKLYNRHPYETMKFPTGTTSHSHLEN
mgnify:CR=1 FL=1